MIPAVPPSPPATVPAAGHMVLDTQRIGGRPRFLLTGERLVVQGTVSPFVAGQRVRVRFTEDGRGISTSTVSVLAGRSGMGRFRLAYTPRRPGLVQVLAT